MVVAVELEVEVEVYLGVKRERVGSDMKRRIDWTFSEPRIRVEVVIVSSCSRMVSCILDVDEKSMLLLHFLVLLCWFLFLIILAFQRLLGSLLGLF